jgi:hypothetical protein
MMELSNIGLTKYVFIQNDISPATPVIPGSTRNPVFSWIPAGVYPVLRYGAGMTILGAINVVEYSFRRIIPTFHYSTIYGI